MQLLTAVLQVTPLFEFMLTITLQVTFPGSGTFVQTASYTIYNGKSLIFYLNHSLFLTASKENASCVFSKSEATFVPDEGWVCPDILCL